MSKQIFKDFVIKAKRAEPVLPPRRERLVEESVSFTPKSDNSKSFFSVKNVMGIFIMAMISLGGFFQLTTMFSKVIVKITPIEQNVALEDVYTASLSKDANGDYVQYKIMKVEETESSFLVAGKGEVVSKKASGEIVVYNAYSEASQKLIAGTRFETGDGKIYKIDKAITVPGRTTVGGKMIPGSLTVIVSAGAPGEEYNIPASDFTLPGLKESPRYKSVFARGKGEMTGGFVGEMKTVSPEDILSAKNKLQTSIFQKLGVKAKNQVPAGYVFYDDASTTDFKDNSSSLGKNSTGNQVSLTVTGTMEIAIFSEKELSGFIARKKLPEVKNNSVHSPDLSKLDFKILNKDNLNLAGEKSFSFKISGNANIVWDFNATDFKQNLAGLDKDKYQEIFKKYGMIDKAETIFKPSWSSSFPADPERITVELIEK